MKKINYFFAVIGITLMISCTVDDYDEINNESLSPKKNTQKQAPKLIKYNESKKEIPSVKTDSLEQAQSNSVDPETIKPPPNG